MEHPRLEPAVLARLLLVVLAQVVVKPHPAVMMVVLIALMPFGFLYILPAAPQATRARNVFFHFNERLGGAPRPAGFLPGAPLLAPAARPKKGMRR